MSGGETSLNRSTRFMRDELCAQLRWGLPGSAYTNVQCVQCWSLPDARLVLVEVYRDDSICGGFDVFPVVRTVGIAARKRVIEGMAKLEDDGREACPACGGLGYLDPEAAEQIVGSEVECPRCGGDGHRSDDPYNDCPMCCGYGYVVGCPECGGGSLPSSRQGG